MTSVIPRGYADSGFVVLLGPAWQAGFELLGLVGSVGCLLGPFFFRTLRLNLDGQWCKSCCTEQQGCALNRQAESLSAC